MIWNCSRSHSCDERELRSNAFSLAPQSWYQYQFCTVIFQDSSTEWAKRDTDSLVLIYFFLMKAISLKLCTVIDHRGKLMQTLALLTTIVR